MLGGPEPTPEPSQIAEPTGLEDDIPSIAVLPFTDMSAEGDQQYFGDGIAEEILNTLSRISGLKVAARTSAFKLRDEDVATVGNRLGVRTVLEGSVRKQGDRFRITAQLIHARDGFHLWSETYDRVITDLFAVQEEIAEAIAGALQVRLGLQPKGAQARGLTDDLEAYDLYLLGRDRWTSRSQGTLQEAIDYFQRAIELDSSFALAHTGLADAYMVMPYYDPAVAPLDVYDRAKAVATRAFELNANLGEIRATLGYLAHTYEWDWLGAEEHFTTAVSLAPGYATAHHWYSNLLASMGEHERAAERIQVALSLDPLSNVIVWSTAARLEMVGRHLEARAQYVRVMEIEPVIPWALVGYASNLLRFEPTDAQRGGELFAEFASRFGYPNPERVRVAFAALEEGSAEAEAEFLAVLEDIPARTVLKNTDLVFSYLRPDPLVRDRFFEVLAHAVEARHFHVPYIPSATATFEPDIMEDPQWEAFLDRIGNPGSGG
jgi:TolB-like protein